MSKVNWSDKLRESHFLTWIKPLKEKYHLDIATITPASIDASFRRYFRIQGRSCSFVLMDAPPDQENNAAFVSVASLMRGAHIRVPDILDYNAEFGFLLLSDLGLSTMMEGLQLNNSEPNQALYLKAVDVLIKFQLASKPNVLPPYDFLSLKKELSLFPEWYLKKHKGVEIDMKLQLVLEASFEKIISNNLLSPKVFVHRDFMPRNLMLPTNGITEFGVLDFQDAVYGPITYDIASLMRDAFISWEEDFCLDITIRYWERARKTGLPVSNDFSDFYRSVEWMGLQRHLKVAGIFARLSLRDGKPRYLEDAPRFINYIRSTCSRYRELRPLLNLINEVEGLNTDSSYAFGRF